MRYEWWQIALGLAVFALIGLASCAHGRKVVEVRPGVCYEVGDREPPRALTDEECWEWVEENEATTTRRSR